MGNTATIRMRCPDCKREMDFVRVVEAHIETAPFTMSTPIGSRINQYVKETPQPLAYCPECKRVLYVGPSAEEVRNGFSKEQERKKINYC